MNLLRRKSILLIDVNDPRRNTRVKLLENAGYAVHISQAPQEVETLGGEQEHDLVLLSLHRDKFIEAVSYADRLQKANPDLPILILSDAGVYVPRGTVSPSIQTGDPDALVKKIAQMLTGGGHIQAITPDTETFGPN
jgi:DNA-binding NtrC family response regulator